MSNQDIADGQDVGVKESQSPPPYTEDQEYLSPPEYSQDGSPASSSTAARPPPRHRFPPIMNAYYIYEFSLATLKTFKLCGATESDFLYSVEVHTGYSGKGPLGTRPGFLLHNGKSVKDPVIAAVGDESREAAAFPSSITVSVILLPPLDPGADPNDMITEVMQANNRGTVFRFSIEVGTEKVRREEFEWRRIDKEAEAINGFNLSRRHPETHSSSGGSSCQEAPGSSLTDGGGETLAVLTLNKATALKHPFSVELKGEGLSGALGERWTLMAVATALRLVHIRLSGRMNKTVIAIGEKLRGE